MEASSVFEPNYKIATPASYALGPGDELLVQVYGYSEQTYNLTVNNEGNVYIPNVGPIAVTGLSVDDAATKIKNRLAATIYKAIKSGQTKVTVTLGKIRSISVTVIGQASKPGTYSIPSLSTLFNLLYICGGPGNQGSYRNIEVIRGNKLYRKVDLYAFLLRGDRKDNVLLQDQDVVRIPYYDTRVSIDGQVRRSGKFEMQPGETLDQLMTYCGGFSDSAYRSMVKAVRVADTGRMVVNVKASEFGAFKVQTGDAFSVSKTATRLFNRVTVSGAVYRPDDYAYQPDIDLRQLLENSGLRPDTYRERGFISRLNNDQSQSGISFNINEVMAGRQVIKLQPEDIVTITSIYDLKDALTVDIQGEIRVPSKYGYRQNMTVKDLILLAGGFTEAADIGSVEVSRRVADADVSAEVYRQANILYLNLRDGVDGSNGNIVLQPYDVVMVRRRSSYENQRRVYVTGQVPSPGPYVLQTSKETISSVVKRAGGFKSSADSSSVSIKRFTNLGMAGEERQRTVERLLSINRDSLLANPRLRETYLSNVDFLSVNVNKIKEQPGGPEDIVLEDGDIIEIARSSSLVRVSGEVYHPTSLPYEKGANAHYYIKRAGNYTSSARRSRAFVIYPDGRSESVKKFLFFKSYPSVTARSEIFVPSKALEGKRGLSTTEWIAISSILASLATIFVTLINNL
jgi:protein involved in polysaccharide export with SLBB domain